MTTIAVSADRSQSRRADWSRVVRPGRTAAPGREHSDTDSSGYGRRVVGTRLRLTARGRRVLAALTAIAVSALVTALVLFGAGQAQAGVGEGAPQDTFLTITVVPGDSLWSIAGRVAPTVDPRDVVDDIKRLNALDGADLNAGQRLAIPAQYAPVE